MPSRVRVHRNVFVTRSIAESPLKRLKSMASVSVWPGELPPPKSVLRAALRDADAILTMVTDRIDADAIARAPQLKVVSNLAVGLDNIDLPAATRAGIAVGHTPGVLTDTTADLAFALLMTTARRVAEGDRQVRAGKWRTWGPKILLGPDVHGATLGIIGFGAIGTAMARRAAGFDMRILYLRDRSGSQKRAAQSLDQVIAGAEPVDLKQLLGESDFISLHVPLTPATRHLLGSREFKLMKPGTILINTARGAVVDQAALVDALTSGHLGGAGLDVTDPEPIRRRDPLLRLSNVVITPHIGSASNATREKMATMAVQNILAAFEGKIPDWCANPEVKLRP